MSYCQEEEEGGGGGGGGGILIGGDQEQKQPQKEQQKDSLMVEGGVEPPSKITGLGQQLSLSSQTSATQSSSNDDDNDNNNNDNNNISTSHCSDNEEEEDVDVNNDEIKDRTTTTDENDADNHLDQTFVADAGDDDPDHDNDHENDHENDIGSGINIDNDDDNDDDNDNDQRLDILAQQDEIMGSQSQATQNIELTQIYDFDENSQFSQGTPSASGKNGNNGDKNDDGEKNLLTIPWGRLSSLSTDGGNGNGNGNGQSANSNSNTGNNNNHHHHHHQRQQQQNHIVNSNVQLLPRSPLPVPLNDNNDNTITKGNDDTDVRNEKINDNHNKPMVHFLGLTLNPSDKFNEYTIGRSIKSDVVATKKTFQYNHSNNNKNNNKKKELEKLKKYQNFTYALISNSHCRIFCLLKHGLGDSTSPTICTSNNATVNATTRTTKGVTETASTTVMSPPEISPARQDLEMEVYIEDTSVNGTFINSHTSLSRNERRLLHTGDIICLLNPKIVHRKIRDANVAKDILNHYSFVFVNLYETCRHVGANDAGDSMRYYERRMAENREGGGREKESNIRQRLDDQLLDEDRHNISTTSTSSRNRMNQSLINAISKNGIRIGIDEEYGWGSNNNQNNRNSGEKRKRGLVNVRATNNHHDHFPFFKKVAKAGEGATTATTMAMSSKNEQQLMPPPSNHLPNYNHNASQSLQMPSVQKTRKQNYKPVEEEYDMRDEIGSGTCGQVRRAIHRQTGKMVAIKVISLGNTGSMHRSIRLSSSMEDDDDTKMKKEDDDDDMKMVNKVIKDEAMILQKLNHPYIIKLIDVFIHPKKKAVYLVMELVHGGDLFDRIVAKGRYSEVESRRVMRRLLAAIHYLHEERGIVHRDLKPENILCVSKYDDVHVKLTDFGLAKSMTKDGLKTFCGTPQYFAPEVLRRRHTIAGHGRYDKKADMWSLGVILYILLSGTPPFDANGSIDTIQEKNISFRGRRWNYISDDAKNLVKALLRTDPAKRISVVDTCSHKWILTEDGDTHIHPLEDPAVRVRTSADINNDEKIEDHEDTKKVESSFLDDRKNEGNEKTPNESLHHPAPQSIRESPTPANNNSLTPQKASPGMLNAVGLDSKINKDAEYQKEVLTPSQAANFPTPINVNKNKQMYKNGIESRRESLFSFVNSLPEEDAKVNLFQKGQSQEEETNVEEEKLNLTLTNSKDDIKKATKESIASTTLDDASTHNTSRKQVTLSRWFEKSKQA